MTLADAAFQLTLRPETEAEATRPVTIKHGTSLICNPGEFEAEKHYYPRVLNAQIHPTVSTVLQMKNERIIARYHHLNPSVSVTALRDLLNYRPEYFVWAGSDLFNVITADGRRRMICIETNSCPSGQKSMPTLREENEYGGYQSVIERSFRDMLDRADPTLGALAVVYDKNPMEASGYAAVIADTYKEPVYLVEYYDTDPSPPVRWQDGVMYVRSPSDDQAWVSVRAAFRYVTQRPWRRFPAKTRTLLLNPIVTCLAGGRNKAMAAHAYDAFNEKYSAAGLAIRTPETRRGVLKTDVPALVEQMGGHAVIKVPYANAGQGIYTITRPEELARFMAERHRYDHFLVQSLVGNALWTSQTSDGRFHHVGTLPNARGETFVADLRVMVSASQKDGFQPVALYARRARKPLLDRFDADPNMSSWEMLGTNLSMKDAAGNWTTASNRLMLMDRKDFNNLGLGVDDLIEAYIQTVMSVVAIDHLCKRLMSPSGFNMELFAQLNPDEALLAEIKSALASQTAAAV